jgi:uncharacterized protein (DUF2062 family)
MDLLAVPNTRKRGIHASKRQGLGNDLREMLAPSMGFRALGRWFILKMIRQTQDPHNVALAAGLGMWVNFLPIPGFGGVVAATLAFLFRVSVPVAFIAQIPSNPLTFPLLWWLCYVTGTAILPISVGGISFETLMQNFHWDYFLANWWDLAQSILLTITLGGQVLGLTLGFITYKVMYRQVDMFWEKRRARQAYLATLRQVFPAEK